MKISKIIKKISLLHSTSTETPTDFRLAREIIDKANLDWYDPNLKLLDPGCGRGAFLLAMLEKLEEHGHSRTHIISNMLYGVDISKIQYMITIKALTMADSQGTDFAVLEKHILNKDILTTEWDMKFDLIAGNPPFQETKDTGGRKSLSTNLWSKFIDHSVNKLVKDNGVVAMITPASWAGPTKNLTKNRSVLKDILAENNTTYINLSDRLNTFFPDVGSTFSYFVLEKKASTNSTEVELNSDTTINIDLNDYSSLPRIKDPLAYSINQKYANKITGEVIQGQLQSASIIKYQEKETADFKWPAYHTPAKGGRIWYTNVKHPSFDKKKVIISLSGKYMPYADIGNIGFTDMCLAYIIKDDETLESAMSVINSKLFHFIMECNKWSGFNNKEVIRNFPLPKLNKVYTDKEIYKYFNLTKEESEFVTNYVDKSSSSD